MVYRYPWFTDLSFKLLAYCAYLMVPVMQPVSVSWAEWVLVVVDSVPVPVEIPLPRAYYITPDTNIVLCNR